MPSLNQAPYRCACCEARTYRRVIQRNENGVMGFAGLYQCSGCSVTFSAPQQWREGTTRQGHGHSGTTLPEPSQSHA